MRWDDLRFMPNVRHLIEARGLSFENSFAPYPLCCPQPLELPDRGVRPQPPRLLHAEPLGIRRLPRPPHGGHRAAGAWLPDLADRQVPQRLRPAADPWHAHLLVALRAAGLDDVDRRPRTTSGGPGTRFHGSTYNYFDLVQNINGRIVGLPGSVHDRRDGPRGPAGGLRLRLQAGALVRVVDAGRAPTGLRQALRAQDDRAARPHHRGPRRVPTGSRAGSTPRSTHGLGAPPNRSRRGRRQRQAALGARAARPHPARPGDRAGPSRASAPRRCSCSTCRSGRTLAEMSRTGALRNTVVVFTSDNGYYLGEHRKMQGKITLHEPSLRVPLLMCRPRRPAGRRVRPDHHRSTSRPTIAALRRHGPVRSTRTASTWSRSRTATAAGRGPWSPRE